MFNKKKHRIEELEKENTRLNLQIEFYEVDIKHLKKRLEAFEKGGRCSGKYCEHCDHYGGEKIVTKNGCVTLVTATCLKDVPCPDFKRRGSPRPNKQEGGPKPHD